MVIQSSGREQGLLERCGPPPSSSEPKAPSHKDPGSHPSSIARANCVTREGVTLLPHHPRLDVLICKTELVAGTLHRVVLGIKGTEACPETS